MLRIARFETIDSSPHQVTPTQCALVVVEGVRLPGVLVAEVEIAEHRETGVLAGEVHRRGRLALQHAGLHRLERLEHADDCAGGKGLDLEAAVGRLADAGAEILEGLVRDLGGAPQRLHAPLGRLLTGDDGGEAGDARARDGACTGNKTATVAAHESSLAADAAPHHDGGRRLSLSPPSPASSLPCGRAHS
jgi:hypothetical protein